MLMHRVQLQLTELYAVMFVEVMVIVQRDMVSRRMIAAAPLATVAATLVVVVQEVVPSRHTFK